METESVHSPGAARSTVRTVVVATLVLAALGLVAHALAYRFVCDDAYISFRYAYNFAHHGELSYNRGERVEGYTNFLWTLAIGLLMRVGVEPELSSQLLGATSGAAALVLLFLLTQKLGQAGGCFV
jgi:arabinofuranosyltransferase